MKKIIHCVWLGEPKTKLALKCRASWKCYAPDWEIREWNTLPADVPRYVRDAAAAGKWAFASDWLRFFVLEREGGVYLDYDVELVAPIERLPDGEWCAAEWLKHGEWGYNPGSGIALEAGSPLARDMLDYYSRASFGTNKTVGDILGERLGPPEKASRLRVLKPEVMSPIDWHGRRHCTEETVGIHHYVLSWITRRRRFARWLSWHGMDGLVQLALRLKGCVR